MDNLIPGSFYVPIFLTIVSFLTIVKVSSVLRMSQNRIMQGESDSMHKAVALLAFMSIFLGGRPYEYPDAKFFADTSGYAEAYINEWSQYQTQFVDFTGDWLFPIFSSFLGSLGFSVTLWFTSIALCFSTCILCANRRLFGNNVYSAILFSVTAFGFYSDVTNGIRNSLACSMAILAISLFVGGSKKDKILAILLGFLATGIHTASTLLIVSAIASFFFLKRRLKVSVCIWLGSLIASFIIGDSITDIFNGLGFDSRMDKYVNLRHEFDAGVGFSHTGFRWDFILYSVIPIGLGWYVTIIKKVLDTKYNVFLNTYILANSFWLLVIRAQFSNRFAMLSWSLYSIVIAYPLFKYKIFNKQQNKIAFALLSFLAFEYFMLLK